jgi:hypothetical protein
LSKSQRILLKHIKDSKLENLEIVELGGGYGGLCLCLSHFSKILDVKISKYNIIDLDLVLKLQEKYKRGRFSIKNILDKMPKI